MKLNAQQHLAGDDDDNFADSWTFFMSHFSLSFKRSKCENINKYMLNFVNLAHCSLNIYNRINKVQSKQERIKNERKQFSKNNNKIVNVN